MRRTMRERWDEDDRMYLELFIKQRLYPTIFGGIVGDALGVPAEFKQRESVNISSMTGYGTYNQPEGTWSDDTSLTMCLIENLIEKKDETDLMKKFAEYRDNGYWTPYGKMFDIGIATNEAIFRYKAGMPVEDWGGASEYDNGNGALMRIAPLLFTLIKEPDFRKRIHEIERIAHITHRHPRSTLGCILYMEYLYLLYYNNDPFKAYKMVVEFYKENLRDTVYEKELPAYSRIMDLELQNLHRDQIKSDGYVVHSLEAAMWCFLHTDSYAEAVLKAVNLGGDTDTIALLTGTMAGMYYKMESIPKEWLDKLARKNDLMKTIKSFFEYCFEKADAIRVKGNK